VSSLAETAEAEQTEREIATRQLFKKVWVAGGISLVLVIGPLSIMLGQWTGTDVAIAASDSTLMSDDLRGLVTAIQLARATMRNIRQNLFFAFIYNVLSIPIAAGILYPAFH
jgi:P-type Cu+ transporter